MRTGYDFCDVRPASIAGNVSDCLADQPLSGVTVQLLDSERQCHRDHDDRRPGQLQVHATSLPGQTYGVSEILPPATCTTMKTSALPAA